jgi:ATP-binding cassette subfamily F protein 3
MAETSDLDDLLEDYQNTLDAFQAIGGDDFESIIHKKLGLASLMKHRDLLISEISGGEFKLIQVIKEMLTHPDVMIMDEPDVFLDFENLEALKNLINGHKGILLVITHNRYLLNHCFNKIIHLENKALQSFDGSYIQYNFTLLESKIELQELAIADQEEIERNEELIRQLRLNATYSSEAAKGRSLRARVKYQERLEARQIQAPFVDIKQPNIILECEDDLEEVTAIKITDLRVDFDENLLDHVNLDIKSTDKVALIGSNGTGKTTTSNWAFC